MNGKKHEIQQSKNQPEEINYKSKNTIKSLQEEIHSLKEDIEHFRTNPNNNHNISEHTDHNYLGKHQTQNALPSKVIDHKDNQPAKNNISQNLIENAQDQQANNTQNHEAIITLPTGTVGKIKGKKKQNKVRHLQQRIMCQSQQLSKPKITKKLQ